MNAAGDKAYGQTGSRATGSQGNDTELLDGYMKDAKNHKKLDPYNFYLGETYGK